MKHFKNQIYLCGHKEMNYKLVFIFLQFMRKWIDEAKLENNLSDFQNHVEFFFLGLDATFKV